MGFFMANIYFPGETVSGPLEVIISRESDAFGAVDGSGSLDTQLFFVVLDHWLHKETRP